MLRIVLIGSVGSSRATLLGLIRQKMSVVGVLGLERASLERVAGYARLDDLCTEHGIPYMGFSDVNSESVKERLVAWSPDLVFGVGLSQLFDEEVLKIPRIACVGFHPTKLPAGRGRAPLAWLVLGESTGAATFFVMTDSADAGPILAQESFSVARDDDATSVGEKIHEAIAAALDEWLPRLKHGEWEPRAQDEGSATWYGIRSREDGWIDWERPADEIVRVIRASTRPHPGAYTYRKDEVLTVWRGRIEGNLKIRGTVGRVLRAGAAGEWLVQCGEGLLWLSGVENHAAQPVELKIGQRLGFRLEDEVHFLRRELRMIRERER